MKNKIKNRKGLKRILSRLKKSGRKIVFTNGCFDILHAGHVSFLKKAKREGDVLVAALNTDASVRKLKGRGRPLVKLKDRMKILASLESVDYVTSFGENTPLEIVRQLKPDVIAKGADWKKGGIVGASLVKRGGGRAVAIALCKGYSTTNIIKKIKRLK